MTSRRGRRLGLAVAVSWALNIITCFRFGLFEKTDGQAILSAVTFLVALGLTAAWVARGLLRMASGR